MAKQTRPFNQVYGSYWNDAKVRSWPEDARVFGLYLLTNSERVTEGYYRLPIPLMADDLQWPAERVRESLARVVESGFAEYDHDTSAVLIVKALKYQPPNGRALKSAVKSVRTAPFRSPLLWPRFLALADKYAPDFADALRKEFPDSDEWG